MASSLGVLSEIQQFPRRRLPSGITGPRISDPRRANARCAKRVRRELPLLKKLASKRIGKLPSSTQRARLWERDQEIMPNDMIMHRFEDTKTFNNALAIFTRLPDVLKLERRTPQIYSVDLNQLEIHLRYTDLGCWKVADCLHWTFIDDYPKKLKATDVHELKESVLKYITLLCDAHILMSSDLFDLRFTYRKGLLGGLWPFLDTFDFSIDPRQDGNGTVDWTKQRRILERKMKSQFRVFEVLAHPEIPSNLRSKIDPEDAVHLLNVNPPPYQPQNKILLLVNKYTSRYGQYVITMASEYLMLIAKRSEKESDLEALTMFSQTIRHVLVLLDGTEECWLDDECVMADRAVIWAAGLAIQLYLHTQVTEQLEMESLLEFEYTRSVKITAEFPDINLVIVRKAQRDAWAAVYTVYFTKAWPRFSLHIVCFNSLRFAIRALAWQQQRAEDDATNASSPTLREISPSQEEESISQVQEDGDD
ncbi:hypothetical protein NPX13_g5560 [Xylaria arbuscula]|uniref:Uncharacterized protein n=1 Tax=Xylaria arbuscula TaxID=114810 RepID=A0A9W8NDT0_9PEZI|nr:hypothetical protein NPX13_g5560 [Xylaria arbuscula]